MCVSSVAVVVVPAVPRVCPLMSLSLSTQGERERLWEMVWGGAAGVCPGLMDG